MMHLMLPTIPSEQTDVCENIYLLQLRLLMGWGGVGWGAGVGGLWANTQLNILSEF